MDRIQAWIWYLLFFLPGGPKIGRPEDGDCLYVQAFGRNGISDDEFGAYPNLARESPWSDAEKFACLRDMNFDAGESNVQLAFTAASLIEVYGPPAFVQWEVAYVIWRQFPNLYRQRAADIVALWPSADEPYFPTVEVKRLSRDLARARGLVRPVELANAWMLPRAILIIAKLEGELPIVFDTHCRRMDRNSVQPWTKAPWRWIPREFLGRLLHHPLKRWV